MPDVIAKVIFQKGTCVAGHRVGDEFVIGQKTPPDMGITTSISALFSLSFSIASSIVSSYVPFSRLLTTSNSGTSLIIGSATDTLKPLMIKKYNLYIFITNLVCA